MLKLANVMDTRIQNKMGTIELIMSHSEAKNGEGILKKFRQNIWILLDNVIVINQ